MQNNWQRTIDSNFNINKLQEAKIMAVRQIKSYNHSDKLYKYGKVYLEHGFSIVPGEIEEAKKGSYINWKKYQKNKPNEKDLLNWINEWSQMGWAIVTGKISGIIVLDIDPDDGGEDTIETKSLTLPPTVSVSTGGGGTHYYYKYPKNCGEIKGFVGKQISGKEKLPGIDLRADGNIVYAPPSPHPSGGSYNFYEGLELKKQKIANAPDWLLEFVKKVYSKKNYNENNSSNTSEKLDWYSQEKRLNKNKEKFAHIEFIKEKNIKDLKKRLNPENETVEVSNKRELKEYIYTRDIGNFLGFRGRAGKKFNCLFHEDTDPSAHIYQKDNEHYIYKCFGACDFDTGNIVQVINKINPALSKLDIIEMLKDIFSINLKHDKNSQYGKAKKLLQKNKMLILDNEFRDTYPELGKLIWRFCNLKKKRDRQEKIIKSPPRYASSAYKLTEKMFMHPNYSNQLLLMHNIGEDYLWEEGLTLNNPTFFTSVRYIQKRFANIFGDSPPKEKICQRNNLFTFLGLLKKIKPENLPEEYRSRSKEIQKNNGHKYMINYFEIPAYTEEILMKADCRSKTFKNKGGTIKGFGWEYLYRTFSRKEADRVFPQLRNRTPSKRVDRVFSTAKSIIDKLIDNQGYCSEAQILNHPQLKDMNMKNKKRKLKQCIGQLMNLYNLTKIQTNKQIKKEYNMDELGEQSYPKVLVPEKNII